MGLQIDWYTQIINVTSPTTEVTAQELADFIEDQMATPVGQNYGDIISPEGKIEDPSNPGVYSQIILIFNSPWQVQFWGGSGYTRLYGGKFVGGLNDQVIKATGTAGDITVLESPVDGITNVVTTGSGLSAPQDAKLTAINNEVTAIEGSAGLAMMTRAIMAMSCNRMDYTDNGDGTYTIEFLSMNATKPRVTWTGPINGIGRDTHLHDMTP